MYSLKQCEIARAMTNDSSSDTEINVCVATLDNEQRILACKEIDDLCRLHDAPFDKAFPVMKEDFKSVAEKYNLNKAALFCVYMDYLNP